MSDPHRPWPILLFAFLIAACDVSDSGPAAPDPIIGQGDPTAREYGADAGNLHQRILTIDSHGKFPRDSCGKTNGQVDIPKMRAGGLDAVFEIVFTAQRERTNAAFEEAEKRARKSFQEIHDAVRRCREHVELASTPEDVERIVASGRIAVAIGVENGFAIGRDLSLLESFRDMGAAYIGLTHEGHNDIADSANPRVDLGDGESEHGGVSAFGERVIAEMNRLGLMVDVSHMSRAATLDAIRLSEAPVIASHSSIHAIVPNPRNMDDETLQALAAKGGVVQITPVHSFIKVDPPSAIEAFSALLDKFDLESDGEAKQLSPPRRAEFESRLAELERRWSLATVGQFVDHIDYAVAVAGVEHVGIGSDFDGGGGVSGWSSADETAGVTVEMLRRGYTEEEIAKIWGGNLVRVWQEARRASVSNP